MKIRRIPKGINVISIDLKRYLGMTQDYTEKITGTINEAIQVVGLLITGILSYPLMAIMIPVVFIRETLESLYYAIKYMTCHTTPEEEEAVQRFVERVAHENQV